LRCWQQCRQNNVKSCWRKDLKNIWLADLEEEIAELMLKIEKATKSKDNQQKPDEPAKKCWIQQGKKAHLDLLAVCQDQILSSIDSNIAALLKEADMQAQ
jgi:hypothetical protein